MLPELCSFISERSKDVLLYYLFLSRHDFLPFLIMSQLNCIKWSSLPWYLGHHFVAHFTMSRWHDFWVISSWSQLTCIKWSSLPSNLGHHFTMSQLTCIKWSSLPWYLGHHFTMSRWHDFWVISSCYSFFSERIFIQCTSYDLPWHVIWKLWVSQFVIMSKHCDLNWNISIIQTEIHHE